MDLGVGAKRPAHGGGPGAALRCRVGHLKVASSFFFAPEWHYLRKFIL